VRLLLLNLKCDPDDPPIAFACEWIEEIAGRCEAVYVITNYLGDYTPPANVTVRSLGGETNTPDPIRALRLWRWSFEALTRWRADLCFAHMAPLFMLMTAPLCRLTGRPSVLWYAHRHVDWMLTLTVALVDACVTSTPAALNVKSPKIRVLSQGVSTAPIMGVGATARDPGICRIVTLGRVSPVKRLELQIGAVALLPPELRETVRLEIVGDAVNPGDDQYLDGLRAQARDLGIEDQVEFTPSIAFRDTPGLWRRADLAMNTAPLGAIDKAALEPMAAGLPCVTANASFITALGPDYEPLCAPSGTPQDLARALEPLVRMSHAERAAVGARLGAIVQAEHSVRAVIDKLFGVFEDLLSRRAGAR
jgi:hypothetical protein